jgi:hypothetical protein
MSNVTTGQWLSLIATDACETLSDVKKVFVNPITLRKIGALLQEGCTISYQDTQGRTQYIKDASVATHTLLDSFVYDGKVLVLTITKSTK